MNRQGGSRKETGQKWPQRHPAVRVGGEEAHVKAQRAWWEGFYNSPTSSVLVPSQLPQASPHFCATYRDLRALGANLGSSGSMCRGTAEKTTQQGVIAVPEHISIPFSFSNQTQNSLSSWLLSARLHLPASLAVVLG